MVRLKTGQTLDGHGETVNINGEKDMTRCGERKGEEGQ